MSVFNLKDIPNNLTLPNYVEYQGIQFAITSLGKNLFSNMGQSLPKKIKTLVLPVHLKSIGEQCFVMNTDLESVTFPETLETIGVNAFSGCSNLRNFKIPFRLKMLDVYGMAGIGSGVLQIDCKNLELKYGCFEHSANLEEININGINLIPDCAFMWCDKLKRITLGTSVSSIYAAAFYNSKPDVVTLKSKEGVTVQGEHYESGGMGTIITENPFVNGDDTSSYPVYVLSVPDGMAQYYKNDINTWRFQYIQEYTQESDVVNAGQIFSYADGNNYMITLEGNKNYVGLHSINSDSKALYIPNSVEFNGTRFTVNSVNGNYFRDLNLQDVYTSSENPFNLSIYSFSPLTYLTATLHIPVGTLESYKNADGWKSFKNIKEEENTTAIIDISDDGLKNETIDIYSITGIKLEAKFEDLPVGIYIVNRKLVIKK